MRRNHPLLKFTATLMLFSMTPQILAAGNTSDRAYSLGMDLPSLSQSQFKYSPVLESGLMAITVLGGVRKPGIHYVPPQANIIEVLALAGGTNEEAKTNEISISAPVGAQRAAYGLKEKFNLRRYLKDGFDASDKSHALPKLQTNDVVFVPEYRPPIDRDVTAITAFIGSLATIFISFILIKDKVTN